jgi:hypothetical protein
LVGINVTTQAPSCNNADSLRQQEHQHLPVTTTPIVATLATLVVAIVATITQKLIGKKNLSLST